MTYADLLFSSSPLIIRTELATEIGLNEAIILQQIRYWEDINREARRNRKDGHFWTYNSYKKWCKQFPFWSERTIRRALTNLENLDLIVTGNYNRSQIDRTKWYRVNYDQLSNLTYTPHNTDDTDSDMTDTPGSDSANLADCIRPEWPDHVDKMTRPIPETTAETSSETTVVANATRRKRVSSARETRLIAVG